MPVVPPEATTCTGPNLTALAATLVGEYHLSRDAAAALLGSVLNMPICAATVQNCCEQVSDAFAPATKEVDAILPLSSVIHLDETSWKQGKVLHWLWIAVGDAITSFAINRHRGHQQLAQWFPNGFAGIVNCDRWRPYERFAQRQLCWSHLERDTRSYRERFKIFCTWGANQDHDRRWRALGRDLLRQWEAVFLFLDVEGVEPTTNTAEQGLRSGVIWRRTTQGTRSEAKTTFVQRFRHPHGPPAGAHAAQPGSRPDIGREVWENGAEPLPWRTPCLN